MCLGYMFSKHIFAIINLFFISNAFTNWNEFPAEWDEITTEEFNTGNLTIGCMAPDVCEVQVYEKPITI